MMLEKPSANLKGVLGFHISRIPDTSHLHSPDLSNHNARSTVNTLPRSNGMIRSFLYRDFVFREVKRLLTSNLLILDFPKSASRQITGVYSSSRSTVKILLSQIRILQLATSQSQLSSHPRLSRCRHFRAPKSDGSRSFGSNGLDLVMNLCIETL
jgi:hypothetical protein